MPAEGIFGVKLAHVMAGVAGGVVSLAYVRTLSSSQMVLAVITGAATAAYGTPLAGYALARILGADSPSAQVEGGLGFVLGITAMNLIPGIVRLSEMFRRDPAAVVGMKGGES